MYEQHRLMQEQHAALVQKVADSAFKALRAENRRLEQELAVLRDCVARHSVRTPVALSEGPGSRMCVWVCAPRGRIPARASHRGAIRPSTLSCAPLQQTRR